jgi:hypothetical protein
VSSPTLVTPRASVPRGIGAWPTDRVLIVGLAALAIVVFVPVFSTGFILTDDHEILSFTAAAVADPQLALPPTLAERIALEIPGGRVRPLYWVLRYAEIDLLGANPLAWHVLFLGLGIVSAALLFGTLRLAGIDALAALLASAWLLIAPGASSVWMRLGPVESLGVPLVVVAAYSAARGATRTASRAWDVLFTVSLVAATLTKEPFSLVPPALVGMRLFLRHSARGRAALTGAKALVPTVIPVAIGALVALLSLKVTVASGDSYSGRILTAADFSTTSVNLEILTWDGGVVVPLLAVAAVLEAARRRRLTTPLRDWLLGASLVLLLVVPQLAVYRGGFGFIVGRYVLPAGLGMIVGIAAGNAWLKRQKYYAFYAGVSTLLGFSLLLFGLGTWREAELFRADSSVLAQAVGAITASARPAATVGIAADPAATYEFATSIPYQLAWRGRADLDRRLLIVQGPLTDPTETAALGAALAAYFPGRGDLAERGCTNVDAVVLLAPEDRVVDLLPCLAPPQFRLATFSETVSVSGFVPPPWRDYFPPQTVRYQLLVRDSL